MYVLTRWAAQVRVRINMVGGTGVYTYYHGGRRKCVYVLARWAAQVRERINMVGGAGVCTY